MIENTKKISYDNRGSALIMALVVSAVLMVLSLSLLAVSYSFFLSQKNNTSGINEREMFYSAIEAFEQELTSSGHNDFSKLNISEIDEDEYNKSKDDISLIGTQIVDSIFNYFSETEMESGGIIIDGVNSWNCINLSEYQNLDENEMLSYINQRSRFFELTCIGAYDIRIQMYWELDPNNIESLSDKYEHVILHVIYQLVKGNTSIIKTFRTYQLGSSIKGIILKQQDQNNDPQQETDQIVRDYEIQFKTSTSKEPFKSKFSFDKFYSGYYPKYIYLSLDEVNENNIVFNQEVDSKYRWYTGSDCTDKLYWDGKPQSIGLKQGTKQKIARTDWGYVFPVRIRFVINGYCLDLDAETFKYNYYVDPYCTIPEEQRDPGFYESTLKGFISDALLELCKINVNKIDNAESIIWVQKIGNNYEKFFENGNPHIINPELLNDFRAYYVYATFPSDYNNNTYEDGLKKTINNYNSNNGKIINLDEVNQYNRYSFERIIGEQ